MRFAAICCAILLAAASSNAQEGAATPPPPTPSALAEVAKGAIDGYILQAYVDLDDAAARLSGSLVGFCSTRTAATADDLRASFGMLLRRWAGVDFIDFGPMTRDNRASRFAFWPDPHGTAERQLRRLMAGSPADLPLYDELAKQSAAIQGLPALELLLFAPAAGALIDDNAAPDPPRCALAEAIAANLATIAAAVNAEWRGNDGWRALMLAPGPGNPAYVDANQPVADILRSLLQGIEGLRDQRIQPARGPTPEAARIARAPYWRSGLTVAYWRASAEALFRYAMAANLTSLAPKDVGDALEREARFEFGNLGTALDAVEPPLDRALVDPSPRDKLGYAMIVLQSLRDIYRNRLPGAAGFSPGFNALDGD